MVTSIVVSTASVRANASVSLHRWITATSATAGGILTGGQSGLDDISLGASLDACASGEDFGVQLGGIAVLEAGETLVAGDRVGAVASGKVGKTSVTKYLGEALESGASGAFIRVRMR